MNWLVITVVGAAAAWFEFNYQRSRRSQKRAAAGAPNPPGEPTPVAAANPTSIPVSETARVAGVGNAPSIAPGDENDKKLNRPDADGSGVRAYSTHAQV